LGKNGKKRDRFIFLIINLSSFSFRFLAQRQTCGGADEPIQSARLNGHDPYAYLKDVLARLPTQKMSQIDELLPHKWRPA